MKFVLIVIILLSQETHLTSRQGVFDNMVDCFEHRETIVKELGRPIENYQAVCVQYNTQKAPK